MELLAEQTVVIERNVAVTFAYVTNMENFSEWFPGVLSVASADSMPHSTLGKEYRETVSTPNGGEQTFLLRVKEARPDKLFVTEADHPPLLPRMEVEFAPSGDRGSTVTWRMFSRNEDPVTRATVVPLAQRVIGERAAQAIVRLKQKLESDTP